MDLVSTVLFCSSNDRLQWVISIFTEQALVLVRFAGIGREKRLPSQMAQRNEKPAESTFFYPLHRPSTSFN